MVLIRKMKCPNQKCRKRVCDIGIMNVGKIIVELKCPGLSGYVGSQWKEEKDT